MKRKIEEDFEDLCRTLTQQKWLRRKKVSFRELCGTLGYDTVEMENMLYESVGVSGEDAMKGIRGRKPQIFI